MDATLKKMSLDQYQNIVILNKPKDISLFDEIDYTEKYQLLQDCLIIFIENLQQMKDWIYKVEADKSLEDKGYLFFLYPKLNNPKGLPSIHRDEIFPYLNLDMGGNGFVENTLLKFSRMVKFDDNYTVVGLKAFKKKPKEKKEVSGRVGDYEHHIPNMIDRLKSDPLTLNFFNQLTKGKQKDWARHIYSAQKEETREKRWEKLYEAARNN